MKTILLTGATGYLGSHIIKSLLKDKYFVIGVKRKDSSLKNIREILNNKNFKLINSNYITLTGIYFKKLELYF